MDTRIIFTLTEKAAERVNETAKSGDDEALTAELEKTIGAMIRRGSYTLRSVDTPEDRLTRIEDKLDGLRKFTFARMARGRS